MRVTTVRRTVARCGCGMASTEVDTGRGAQAQDGQTSRVNALPAYRVPRPMAVRCFSLPSASLWPCLLLTQVDVNAKENHMTGGLHCGAPAVGLTLRHSACALAPCRKGPVPALWQSMPDSGCGHHLDSPCYPCQQPTANRITNQPTVDHQLQASRSSRTTSALWWWRAWRRPYAGAWMHTCAEAGGMCSGGGRLACVRVAGGWHVAAALGCQAIRQARLTCNMQEVLLWPIRSSYGFSPGISRTQRASCASVAVAPQYRPVACWSPA